MNNIPDIGKITVTSIPNDDVFNTTKGFNAEEMDNELKRRWRIFYMTQEERLQEARDKKINDILNG